LSLFFRLLAHFSPAVALLAAAQVQAPPPIGSGAFVRPQIVPTAVRKFKIQPPNAVPEGEILAMSRDQAKDGPLTRLRGNVYLETSTFLLKADELDWNEETNYAEARGNVYFQHFEQGEELWADRVEYNLAEETGKFYNVRGQAPIEIDSRPGILRSDNPFYFQGKWAERLKEKYVLHDGFITNCKVPNPWWRLRGPKFDVIPNDRALAYRAVFKVRNIPLFYAPYFYKSLEREPRKSGFLTPNLGNSSRRGKMVGAGYYWAINRSYDATYRTQYFTQRGFAHTADIRGKPRAGTDFNAFLYGVSDRGLKYQDFCEVPGPGGTQFVECTKRRKEGGFIFSFSGRSDLKPGLYVRTEVNYLSSLNFRQAFTESFHEAIGSEVHSVGFLTRDWSSNSLDVVIQRLENFQSLQPGDTIVIRKMPELNFSGRDRRIWRNVPLWISWDSSAGLLRRTQLLFQTRQNLERADLQPRVMTALRWKEFNFLPSFSVRGTHYGESWREGRITGRNVGRFGREFSLAVLPPSLARIYRGPAWFADQVKHVIEPRLSFRHVAGIDDFDQYIRFDDTELYSNTTEAEISITNRLYAKRNNQVEEVFSWTLWQRRYFDPDFGGAVIEGRRNVVLSSIDLTPFAFLDRPRRYSPVVSLLRMSPRPGFGIEWRSDYDPLRSKVVNNGITADGRFGKYFVSLGHNSIRSVPLLSPPANQLRGVFMVGEENRRGWNAAFMSIYDFRIGVMQFAQTQVTYNTDCCGISFQYRRLSFGTRNENQFRVAFAVANIGTFGTLKRQERMF
jgi:LPS-assembly protein